MEPWLHLSMMVRDGNLNIIIRWITNMDCMCFFIPGLEKSHPDLKDNFVSYDTQLI